MDQKRILFVDDDPNILSGIRRVLRSMRGEFELHFAENGRDALELMATTPFDAVVSDMRMPGMDGAEYLKIVQERYPCTIRIMLTGQANQESILRTVGVMHQFLEKPSNPEILKTVLVRSSALYGLLAEDRMKEMVSRIESLPSLPDIYARLQSVMASPDVSVDQVGAIIEQDMAMSAKVLQLVNSAFFGLFQRVESPARAVALLGLETIKGLVLGVQVFSSMKNGSPLFSLNNLMEHSMAVGACARKIAAAETDDKTLIDHSFIGGILHDVGKLILTSRMREQFDQAILLAQEQHCSLREAEMQIFHTAHDSVGAYLIGLWGFPVPVVEAIGFHHRVGELHGDVFSPALAVHAADSLYYCCLQESQAAGGQEEMAVPGLDYEYLEKLGLAGRVETWRKLCAELLPCDEPAS
jgi:HD-like signal output (HDOD) protein